jgi:hypothetical protein
MMGMRMPETCWAVSKRQVINLRSCCILLVDSVESMMMHGLANPKLKKKDSHCTINLISRRFCITIIAVEKTISITYAEGVFVAIGSGKRFLNVQCLF